MKKEPPTASWDEKPLREFVWKKSQSAWIPVTVYRIQFHKGFTFRDAALQIPYLHELGVEAIYASPYFRARPGSTHGYDVIDPTTLNPELGTPEDYAAYCESLSRYGMQQVVDVVPNHMGIRGPNALWQDVLENGPSSVYARFFDINWEPEKRELKNKVLLPILGDYFGRVLENGEIQLAFTGSEFVISYGDCRLPVAPETYPFILEQGLEELKAKYSENDKELLEFLSIITAFRNLPPRTEVTAEKTEERCREKEVAKDRLKSITQASAQIREFIASRVALFNGQKGNPRSFDLLEQLLDLQAYRVAYWRVAAEEINYRRFFDINDLAAIRVEDEEVFEYYHQLVFRLLAERKIRGLRIDHPDGLYDPPAYFRRLQTYFLVQEYLAETKTDETLNAESQQALRRELAEAFGKILDEEKGGGCLPLFVVAEKILDRKESLPDDWKVHGTVGYDFLNQLGGLFVQRENEKALSEIYENFIGHPIDFEQLVYDKKKFFALVHMASEIRNLAQRLDQISERNRHYRDFTLNNLAVAIREIIASFPVYRTYISPRTVTVSERDEKYIRIAIEKAKHRTPALSHALYDFLRDILLLKLIPDLGSEEELLYHDFVLRFQQLTAPIMAKGLEDTAFYVDNRLLSLNEVGGDPTHFGTTVEEFHKANLERQQRWPATFLASSTHDTKRSEDVRMRLNVLSELPEEWKLNITKWSILNEKHKTLINGVLEPRRNTEYLIYQTLMGAWPNEEMDEPALKGFTERIWRAVQKSIREAKIYTNWVNPNMAYEEAIRKFVFAVLNRSEQDDFFREFLPFQRKIAHYGMLNSLSALVLKIGSPGVVDTYQGCESWNYSLVDPDNRRPVDFDRLRAQLEEVQKATASETLQQMLKAKADGRIKIWLTWKGLNLRRKWPELFIGGEYVPLRPLGERAHHVLAFLRKQEDRLAVFVATRFFTALDNEKKEGIPDPSLWQGTRLALSKDVKTEKLKNVLTGREVEVLKEDAGSFLSLTEVLKDLPFAILTSS